MVFKSTLLVCLAAASVTAFADPQPVSNMQESTALSFRHVNFSRPDEVATLYRNIRYAAERVCGPSNVPGFHFDSPKYAQCYDRAVNDASCSSVKSAPGTGTSVVSANGTRTRSP